MARAIPAVATTISEVSADGAVREALLANYVEMVGAFVVGGAGSALAFLRACVLS